MKLIKILSVSTLIFITGCGGEIEVGVNKSTGGPVSSAVVNLTGEGKTLVGNTNIKGKVSFEDLDCGTYTISTAATTSYSAATITTELNIFDQMFSGGKSKTIVVGVK